MKEQEFSNFAKALSDVAGYYGKPITPESMRIWWNALNRIEFKDLRSALNNHVSTSRFMPTIADVLDQFRAAAGRLTADEAWALVARCLNDESVTVVWTEETSLAFGVALGLQNDRIAARIAFKDAYGQAVDRARRAGEPVKWTPCLGTDPAGRAGPLLQAEKDGKLPAPQVAGLLPYREAPNVDESRLLAKAGTTNLLLAAPPTHHTAESKRLLTDLTAKLRKLPPENPPKHGASSNGVGASDSLRAS